MRPYKDYSWKDLLRIRDALQILLDTTRDKSPEWDVFDEEMAWVSYEIDHRYKHNTTKGE
jgi:hypothetical protein